MRVLVVIALSCSAGRLVPGQALSVRRQRNRHVQAFRVRHEVRPTGRARRRGKALDEFLRFQGLAPIVDTAAHNKIALKTARQGIVLLKNEGGRAAACA